MSFYGSAFTFDGVSSEDYGLMLYDFNNVSQGNSAYASDMTIQEDRIPLQYKSLYYGSYFKEPLEFTLVFGADEYTALNHEDIDRQEMDLIGSWLTGKQGYRWLSIAQPDLFNVRYRCIITDLKVIEFSGFKWAFQCTVHCDSPFGYLYPEEYNLSVSGEETLLLRSLSSYHGYYYPKVELSLNDGGSFTITNMTDNQSKFSVTDYPSADTLVIDGEHGIITSKSIKNPYVYCNFDFPKLVRGDNILKFSGNGNVKIICEFPVNIGG